MKTVRIAGVPEHFNLPWHLCIENGEFDEVAIDLQWTDVQSTEKCVRCCGKAKPILR